MSFEKFPGKTSKPGLKNFATRLWRPEYAIKCFQNIILWIKSNACRNPSKDIAHWSIIPSRLFTIFFKNIFDAFQLWRVGDGFLSWRDECSYSLHHCQDFFVRFQHSCRIHIFSKIYFRNFSEHFCPHFFRFYFKFQIVES